MTQLARRSTPVIRAGGIADDGAAGFFDPARIAARTTSAAGIEGTTDAERGPGKGTSVVSSQSTPSIRQRRIAVENDLAGGQGALALLHSFFGYQRVIKVQ